MAESFTQKQLEFSVELANNTQTNQPNTFAESGTDTATITNKRASVRITNSGAPSATEAQVFIYGLSGSIQNQLSTLGMVLNLVPRNTLTIKAGDDQSGLSTVFRGTIVNAYGDFSALPENPFILTCQAGLADATANVQPTSYPQATDVATIMASFARQMNLGFENSGVNVTLPPCYFRGSAQQQMRQAAEWADINAEVINGNVLAIWPKFGSRNTPSRPLIAKPPNGNMIRDPSFTQQGVLVSSLFDPRISFGGEVEIQTEVEALQKANGIWTIYKLDLALDSQVPKGEWRSTMYCYNQQGGEGSGAPNPIIPPR